MKNKLIIIMFIVLLGGLGVIFWMQKNNLEPQTKNQAQNNETRINLNKKDLTGNTSESLSEEDKEIAKKMALASIMSNNLKEIETALVLYSMGNNNLFPKLLSDLVPQYITKSGLVEMIDSKKILYSYSSDRKKYHIGIDIDLPDTEEFLGVFKYDKDLNSELAGYINGFDGKDPIYDLAN